MASVSALAKVSESIQCLRFLSVPPLPKRRLTSRARSINYNAVAGAKLGAASADRPIFYKRVFAYLYERVSAGTVGISAG